MAEEKHKGGGMATMPPQMAPLKPGLVPQQQAQPQAAADAQAQQDKPRPPDVPVVVDPPQGGASFVSGSARAPSGWTRFRIRGEVPGGNHPVRYVLAKNQKQAEEFYLAELKLKAEAAMVDKQGAPVLTLVTRQMPD